MCEGQGGLSFGVYPNPYPYLDPGIFGRIIYHSKTGPNLTNTMKLK